MEPEDLAICMLYRIKCFADIGRIKIGVGKMGIKWRKVVRVRETSWFVSYLLSTTSVICRHY